MPYEWLPAFQVRFSLHLVDDSAHVLYVSVGELFEEIVVEHLAF